MCFSGTLEEAANAEDACQPLKGKALRDVVQSIEDAVKSIESKECEFEGRQESGSEPDSEQGLDFHEQQTSSSEPDSEPVGLLQPGPEQGLSPEEEECSNFAAELTYRLENVRAQSSGGFALRLLARRKPAENIETTGSSHISPKCSRRGRMQTAVLHDENTA
jgi:hypothetical protein